MFANSDIVVFGALQVKCNINDNPASHLTYFYSMRNQQFAGLSAPLFFLQILKSKKLIPTSHQCLA